MEVKLCLEETEWDHPGEVDEEQEEVLGKEEQAEAGWEEHALELDLVGIVFVPTVGQKCPIKQELPATA